VSDDSQEPGLGHFFFDIADLKLQPASDSSDSMTFPTSQVQAQSQPTFRKNDLNIDENIVHDRKRTQYSSK